MAVLADTGVLIAAADSREPRHASCAEILRAYRGQVVMTAPGGRLVGASVVTVAEKLKITTIATLNRRDFTVVRPRHAAALELLP